MCAASRPDSALKLLVWTLNACSASGFNRVAGVF